MDYVTAENEGVPYKRRMIGSTEALESIFSGYKRLAGKNRMSVNGLGRLILCMSSRTGEFSEEIVHAAVTGVKCRDVKHWLRQAFPYELRGLEEKREQSIRKAACNF